MFFDIKQDSAANAVAMELVTKNVQTRVVKVKALMQ